MVEGPLMLLGGVAAITAICGCIACSRFRCRDIRCVKSLLRWLKVDEFDDLELMVLVHECSYQAQSKTSTAVRVSAGRHTATTDYNKKGVFQQPLHIFVAQGTSEVRIDVLNESQRVLATLPLKVKKDLLDKEQDLAPETLFGMKQKVKGFLDPKVKLTLIVGKDGDLEEGLLAGVNSDVECLVRMQMRKHSKHNGNEMEVLSKACSGSLELFEGLGKSRSVHAAVVHNKHWEFGLWSNQAEFDQKKEPFKKVDMLKISSVPGDPARAQVFVINYFKEDKSSQKLTFRATGQPRDVWVEMLQRLVTQIHQAKEEKKHKKQHGK